MFGRKRAAVVSRECKCEIGEKTEKQGPCWCLCHVHRARLIEINCRLQNADACAGWCSDAGRKTGVMDWTLGTKTVESAKIPHRTPTQPRGEESSLVTGSGRSAGRTRDSTCTARTAKLGTEKGAIEHGGRWGMKTEYIAWYFRYSSEHCADKTAIRGIIR